MRLVVKRITRGMGDGSTQPAAARAPDEQWWQALGHAAYTGKSTVTAQTEDDYLQQRRCSDTHPAQQRMRRKVWQCSRVYTCCDSSDISMQVQWYAACDALGAFGSQHICAC